MQKLKYEKSWEQNLSQPDRNKFELAFPQIDFSELEKIDTTSFWYAENHREELLFTVLVHNQSDTTLTFKDTPITLDNSDGIIAEHTFTIPQLEIPPETSMPWTFIFPKGNWKASTLDNEQDYKLKIPAQ
ncbi:SLAP domain-containing protein [Halalkalibacillus sediminis]|uniref:SLAP domain-containing protein n=1 Tax=Halalkalibacillus sediminis TaxID=2018042 RepID=A0A2I0QRB5_9BACI|nr:SLAP domain-containing protein [Halalkalibacillus sediminis]PKR76876.1 SLAP domain-containing protein [Halalkalibacillus sediminis]